MNSTGPEDAFRKLRREHATAAPIAEGAALMKELVRLVARRGQSLEAWFYEVQ